MVIVKINEEPFAKALQFLINYLDCNIRTEKADEISVELKNGVVITSPASISRYLARVNGKLYGSNDFERSLIDHWMDFSTLHLPNKDQLDWNLKYLNNTLSMATYLVGDILSLADVFMAVALRVHGEFQSLLKENKAPSHIARYYNLLGEKVPIEVDVIAPPTVVVASSNAAAPAQDAKKERKAEGKFVSLPGAEMGKVVVRFPPEASGYLHAGHAKASLLNQYYQQMFDGKLILRFDDTNPEKEDADFEKVILEDVALLGIKPDRFTRTSDHFDLIIDLCTKMIKNGQAYADDTDPETMKEEREKRVESKNRNNDVAKNLSMWNEMQQGTEYGKKCCIRAKLDMNSDNGCLRDPTMYRCKVEEHVATGNKYKVYPTYDFACPVVDSLEGVTHALRTMEYHDRDEQYYWFIDTLGIRKPFIWEFSRLNLMNTVMSKRKLTWLVNEKIVDGWDDPRLPTVRGVMRRGMTVEGLKEFVIAQGSSRTAATMEWDKIWAFNKKVIDPIAPRYVALQKDSVVPVFVRDAVKESKELPKHPKEESVGLKTVWYGSKVFIEGADAAELLPNEVVTFINWGNLVIEEIKKNGEGKVVSVHARLNLDNKDFKKTQKLTWLPEVEEAQLVPTVCCTFDHIISKPVLVKDEDFKQYINRNSKTEMVMLGDPELAKLKKGDIIQLQRRGYFICDSPYEYSRHSCRESPCVLFNIPDGHIKEMPVAGSKFKATNGEAKETKEVEARQSIRKKVSKPSAPKKEESKQASGQTEASILEEEILKQGDDIRQLKELLESKIVNLNSLKQQYKNVAGLECKPNNTPAVQKVEPKPSVTKVEPKQANSNDDINNEITKLGDVIRQLKVSKASKEELKPHIEKLLSLKKQFKEATGEEWKAGSAPAVQKEEPKPSVTKVEEPNSQGHLDGEITRQGELVRQLKASKASKEELKPQIDRLLALKKQFKEATGEEWKAGIVPAVQKEEPQPSVTKVEEPKKAANSHDHLDGEIMRQGEIVRQLKASKASKEDLKPHIDQLLALKKQFKEATGEEWKAGIVPAVQKEVVEEVKKVEPVKQKNKKEEKTAKSEPKVETSDANGKSREVKKVTRTGMEVKKDENFSEWFSQVITKSDMIEYYNISGCYILNPWSYGIWEVISSWFNVEIQKIGFKNCYFPMFVSHSALETEKQHIADFAPEVAWVTKSGETDLAEPIAIRPTSETVMYPSFAKKVQSHKDLPIKINQWCNVVRWEFKHPQPFLRTREFLWQEGHSAHLDYKEAEEEVYYILDLYSKVYHDLLAVPVIKGRKTEKEKFAGGDYTTTIEAYIPASGRGIQAATSHHLGQNFAKMFDISFQDPESGEKRFAFQNSWGLTTRSIGVAVMVHGDDKGLVLPPRVASIQVIIVPCGITAQLSAEDRQKLLDECKSVASKLVDAGVKAECDLSDDYSPGWKFNKWELKGVPVRVELGPKDLKAGQFVAVRRDTGVKMSLKLSEVESTVGDLLKDIHNCMFEKAKKELDANVVVCDNFNDFLSNLDCNRLLLAPFCGEIACEEDIKKSSTKESSGDGTAVMGAKGLCIPFDQPAPIKEGDKCIGGCSHAPRYYTLFGRSY